MVPIYLFRHLVRQSHNLSNGVYFISLTRAILEILIGQQKIWEVPYKIPLETSLKCMDFFMSFFNSNCVFSTVVPIHLIRNIFTKLSSVYVGF